MERPTHIDTRGHLGNDIEISSKFYGSYLGLMKLRDYFKINRSGRYRLEFEQRFYFFDDKSQPHSLILPPATTMVDIQIED